MAAPSTIENRLDPVALVPLPRSIAWTEGSWRTPDPWGDVRLALDPSLPENDYALEVTPDGATLTAGSATSMHDGRHTFAQLVDASTPADDDVLVPCLRISDGPRFAWRGVLLDVARHYMPLDTIRALLDAMALHRLNVLHLHLTDDQGWRMEITGYPRLTEVGSVRARTLVGTQSSFDDSPESAVFDTTPHAGMYTQADLRELVIHAQRRGITIVPEFELPGHVQAAIAAYPQLGTDVLEGIDLGVREVWGTSQAVLAPHQESFRFVRDVLAQMADVFPSPCIHVGGRPSPDASWARSANAQRYVLEHGLRSIADLHDVFLHEAVQELARHDRRAISWNTLRRRPHDVPRETAPPDTIAMSGGDDLRDLLRHGRTVVVADADALRLDRYQGPPRQEPLAHGGRTDLEDTYRFQPVPASATHAQADLVIGIEAALWTEYIPTPEQLFYMAFPRLAAFSEVAWNGPRDDYEGFLDRLERHLPRLDALAIGYRPLDR